ncbi:MAG TPA: L-threonylcarbamoyladenylate synthase [Anaerolineales bacterium]|jgi:L-threonylcarbamoyladenylate synthase|nr:L-threonylcarbamoyladenylate synthase [Anaerolineales bacterium]
MQTEVLAASSEESLRSALDVLSAGGLVAFPTDTVYGVGALAFDGPAIESIYIAKDRPVEKAIPILISDTQELDKVGMNIPEVALQLASHFWPGPLTILVPKRPDLPASVSATSTVGVRVPDHEVARSLLRLAGPLAVTSANMSGAQSPVSAEEVYEQLIGRIPLILDGGPTSGGVPSTLVDCTTQELKILREGPIRLEELLSALAPHPNFPPFEKRNEESRNS